MRRPSLDRLPEIELPDGYTIRTYPEGGESHWVRVCQAAFEDETYDEDWFEQQMQGSPDYRPDRIIFVCGPRQRALRHRERIGGCPAGRRSAVSIWSRSCPPTGAKGWVVP